MRLPFIGALSALAGLKTYAVLGSLAFAAGFTAGVWTSNLIVDYSQKRELLKQVRKDQQRIADLLKLNTSIDDTERGVEGANDEIYEAILRKMSEPAPVAAPVSPGACASDPDPVCADARIMRDIGRLR